MLTLLLAGCGLSSPAPKTEPAPCDSAIDTGSAHSDDSGTTPTLIDTAACEPYWGTLRTNLAERDDTGDIVAPRGETWRVCGAVAGTGAVCEASCDDDWGAVLVLDAAGGPVTLPVTDTMDDWSICLEISAAEGSGYEDVTCIVHTSTSAITLEVEVH